MKNIVVWGADGFIGSHFVEMLLTHQYGIRVTPVVMYNSTGSIGNLRYVDGIEKLNPIFGDIRDSELVLAINKDADLVINFAALISIPFSYVAPRSYVETNILGTLNLLESLKRYGNRGVLLSTSEVYGTARYVPMDEDHPVTPQSPYSATKIAADMLARAFEYTYEIDVVMARPFNSYGPRQSTRAVIPSMIQQALRDEKIHVGNLQTTRDFTYVSDTCAGIWEVAQIGNKGSAYNIASGREIRIASILNQILDITGCNVEVVCDDKRIRPDASEVNRLLGSSENLKSISNWSPKVSFEEGLSRTIEFFKENSDIFYDQQFL